jgi:hypothetical protein
MYEAPLLIKSRMNTETGEMFIALADIRDQRINAK